MCTRPKLINIGAFQARARGYAKWNHTHYDKWKFAPCGMCIECRNMRREEYTQRLKHEIETANYVASFITLTYRDDSLPLLTDKPFKFINYSDNVDYDICDAAVKSADPNDIQKIVVGSSFGGLPPVYGSTLSRSDAKNFCDKLTKRFRRKYGKLPFKYICAGQYGDEGHRPHLHLIIVGLPASERKMVYDCWNKGRVDIEPVGNGAIRYTLSYIDKQVFGANEIYASYGDFEPPFCLFSKGIGTKWIEKNLDKFDRFGKIKFGDSGRSYTLNPYYRRKYDFDVKDYTTPYSDSVVKLAAEKKISLYDAYVDRCHNKEIELQRKLVKRREPLYVASKNIIKKDWDNLKRKRNIDIYDCQQFTQTYLKRDEWLIFKRDFMNCHFKESKNIINKAIKKMNC